VNGAIYALPYDVLKDFEPISLISSNPAMIVAKKAMPALPPAADISSHEAMCEKCQKATSRLVGPRVRPWSSRAAPSTLRGRAMRDGAVKFVMLPARGAAPRAAQFSASRTNLRFIRND